MITEGPKLSAMAWRNLWRHRRRTILTLIAIAFGVLLAVMFTALQDYSFAEMIDTAARTGSGHVTVQHPDFLDTPRLDLTLAETDRVRRLAADDPLVERAVERISGQIIITTARDYAGAGFIAYDPAVETDDTFAFADGLVAGQLFESSDDDGIVLGRVLAQNLGLELGDRVVFRMTDREGEIVGGLARLVGLVTTGAPSADAALCLLPIDTLRTLLGYGPNESTQVALFLTDARRSDEVAARLGTSVGGRAQVLTWNEMRPELSGFIAMKVGGARFMELVILLLVAAGIFNTLFVSVMERTREFGIMMAIGYSPGQIFGLIMRECAWFAVIGLALGAAVTAGPYFYLAGTGIDMSAMMGEGGTEVAGIGFDPTLSVGIFPENVVLIGVAVVVATLLSGLYPAFRAARVQPVESIKLV